MTSDQREVRRKLRILEHAEQSGNVSKTCRYFGIGRAAEIVYSRSTQGGRDDAQQ